MTSQGYVSAAQTTAQLGGLVAVLGALAWTSRHPHTMRQWVVDCPPMRRSLWIAAGLLVVATLLAAGAAWAEKIGSDFLMRTLGTWVMFGLAIVALPGSFDLDRRARPEGLPPPPVRRRGTLAALLAVLVVSFGWFLAAGLLFDVRETEVLRGLLTLGWQFPILVLLALLAAPIEELIFRGALQGLLERLCARLGWPAWLAVTAAAAIWAAGHAGLVTPNGIKEGQILVIGLLLGFARRRYGLESAIVIHLGLNAWTLLAQFGLNLLSLGTQ